MGNGMLSLMGRHGIFGVEFFIRGDRAIFSELSPRPHDTGMVTLISQFPNQFELHLRAVLGLPIPSIELIGPSASAVATVSMRACSRRRTVSLKVSGTATATFGRNAQPLSPRTSAPERMRAAMQGKAS